MFLNIMDDNQQQKIGGITPEYPLLVEWHNMNALDVPWHWHEEVEFKYVLQGAIRVRTEQGEYEIREGEASFTNSNILETSESMDRSCNTEIFTVIFNTVLLSGYFQSIFEKNISGRCSPTVILMCFGSHGIQLPEKTSVKISSGSVPCMNRKTRNSSSAACCRKSGWT